VFEHLLCTYTEIGLEIPSNEEVIETLLAVSRFGPLSRRCAILSQVDSLLQKTSSTHLQAEAVYEQSVVLRLKGDISGSNEVLEEFLNQRDTIGRLRSYIMGFLRTSQATNYTYKSDFTAAEAKMRAPEGLDGTEKQLDLIWTQLHSAGRIEKGRGNFDNALRLFQICYERKPLCDFKRRLALAYLADTCIEIDYQQQRTDSRESAESLFDRAATLIASEIDGLKKYAPRSKSYRRLLLSWVEIRIRKGHTETAKRLVAEAISIYETLKDHDIVDRLGHLRTLIALARLSPLCEAEARWNDALNLGRRYNPLEEKVFIVAFLHLSLCVVHLEQEDLEKARETFEYAVEIHRTEAPQFFIPGTGTFLFEEVQRQIEQRIGWKLPVPH
jgi:tetratricopeptide (TPR) repeat protein